MARTLYLPPDRVRRMLNRMAYEVVERNQGTDQLVVFGVRKRGSAVANALAEIIGNIEGRRFEVHPLIVTPFRDDVSEDVRAQPLPPPTVDITGQNVLLIDDVLFTGRTARAALDAVIRYGRPKSIQLAVLVDRGHREYPIHPDYIGQEIPTKYKERVVVETSEGLSIYIEE